MALAVAVIGLLVNLLSAWLLRDRHDHHGHPHGDHDHDHGTALPVGKDLNRHAAFIHVLADALTSVAAIIALLGGLWLGWSWLDPLMGLIGAVIIAVWARGLLLETGKVLLDREMDSPIVAQVRTALAQEADTEVADLHLWRVGRSQYACIVSVVTHGEASADRYKAHLAGISVLVHVTVEVNRCAVEGAG
jgi:cation diffusion facilitator family transporter